MLSHRLSDRNERGIATVSTLIVLFASLVAASVVTYLSVDGLRDVTGAIDPDDSDEVYVLDNRCMDEAMKGNWVYETLGRISAPDSMLSTGDFIIEVENFSTQRLDEQFQVSMAGVSDDNVAIGTIGNTNNYTITISGLEGNTRRDFYRTFKGLDLDDASLNVHGYHEIYKAMANEGKGIFRLEAYPTHKCLAIGSRNIAEAIRPSDNETVLVTNKAKLDNTCMPQAVTEEWEFISLGELYSNTLVPSKFTSIMLPYNPNDPASFAFRYQGKHATYPISRGGLFIPPYHVYHVPIASEVNEILDDGDLPAEEYFPTGVSSVSFYKAAIMTDDSVVEVVASNAPESIDYFQGLTHNGSSIVVAGDLQATINNYNAMVQAGGVMFELYPEHDCMSIGIPGRSS